jgi:hypothetical protein
VAPTVEPVEPGQIGLLNGQPVVVIGEQINGQPAASYLASLAGFDKVTPAGARRLVRKMLRANGLAPLAMADIRKVESEKAAAA